MREPSRGTIDVVIRDPVRSDTRQRVRIDVNGEAYLDREREPEPMRMRE
jgi:hypothetical protein